MRFAFALLRAIEELIAAMLHVKRVAVAVSIEFGRRIKEKSRKLPKG